MASVRALTMTSLCACFACVVGFAQSPTRAETQFAKGLEFAAVGNTKEAIEVFTRLTQDYPRLAEPYEQLAALHVKTGNLAQALPALQAALRLRNDTAGLQEQLGDIYILLAANAYRAASEAQPGGGSAHAKYQAVERLGVRAPAER